VIAEKITTIASHHEVQTLEVSRQAAQASFSLDGRPLRAPGVTDDVHE